MNPGTPLRVATRGSPLARIQTAIVAGLLEAAAPGVTVEPVVVSTRGDRLAGVPLDRIGGQGVFVKEVQAAVLDRRADLAVHSAKDLPPATPDGLVLAAVPSRADARDALVGRRLADLGAGALVATGSARRRAQLANLRPDLTFVELRGNMGTRLARADERGLTVVVAMAALERLDLLDRVAQVLTPAEVLPQVGQGALAVECREDDDDLRRLLASIEDPDGRATLSAERSMLAALGGSCRVPVAGWAQVLDGGGLRLRGMMATGDGRVVVQATAEGPAGSAGPLGVEVARELVEDCGGWALEDWQPRPAGLDG